MFSGGGSNNEVQPQAQPMQTMPMEQSSQTGACAFEIKQFLQCAQNNDDISLCSGFNEAIRQCKEANRNALFIIFNGKFVFIFLFIFRNDVI